MKHDMTTGIGRPALATPPLRTGQRCPRLSSRRLLAAGALCLTLPVSAVEITAPSQLQPALNAARINTGDPNVQIEILADLDLGGANFTFGTGLPQGLGRLSSPDVGGRTVSNGSITISSPGDTNYSLLTFDPTVSWDADIILNDFARIDIDGPAALGSNATVTAAGSSEIRLFTLNGGTNTFDATFFSKITGVDDETTFAVTGDGVTILSALPTFDAIIEINPYSDFDDFAANPAVDPTLQLGANLTGNHAVVINTGTLDLNDFDFTIDSLAGVAGTAVTLGSGTLTTGDDTDTTYAGVISGTGNLVKTGTGMFTLTGVNTYTGDTTVSDGILVFGADQTGTTDIIIENGGTLLVSVDQTGTPTYTIESGGTADLNADLADTTEITVDAGGMLNLNNVDQTLGLLDGGGDIALNGASVTFGDATDTTLSGVISGSGGLTKTGTGNLTLSGMNTYTGPTNINEGTLTLDGDLADNNAVTVAGGATLDLNDNDETLGSIAGAGDIDLGTATLTTGSLTSTFDGTISGTGGLTKQGSGALTLTMDQTYTGSTLISGGTLNANGDLDTSDVTLDAGAFNLGGVLTDTNATVTINGGSATFDMDQVYTGATAINSGMLTANGDLATSGVTVGNGATFALESTMTDVTANVTVDDGGTIYGTGTVGNNLTNNGTANFVGPGAGDTLTVNGDYNQGATGVLNYQLDQGNPVALDVTGDVNLNGTLNIAIPTDPENFDFDADDLAIFSAAGTITLDPGLVINEDFFFLDLAPNIDGNDLEVSLSRDPTIEYSDAATTSRNQAAVAGVLTTLFPAADPAPDPADGTLDAVANGILNGNEAAALATYDQLAGAGAATTGTQNAAFAANQGSRVLDQVSGLAPGSTRPRGAFSQAPGAGSGFDDTEHLTLFSNYESPASREARQDDASRFANTTGKTWATFYGGFGDQGEGAEALDYDRYGVLAGLEFSSVESGARYGFTLGVELSDFEFARSNGDSEITSLYLSGYTRQPLGNNYQLTFNAAFGYHDHETSRTITTNTASADFNSYSVSLAAELSKTFDLVFTPADPGNHPTVTSIEPFARINYSLSSQESYSESGAGSAGLDVDSADFDSIRAAFGVRAQHQFMLLNRHEANFYARGLVDVAVDNSDSRLGVSFVNTPGSSFSIEGSDQDDVFGQVGVGFSVALSDNWDFQIQADQQYSEDANATTLAGGLSFSF